MSVLIRDMDFPTNCHECDLASWMHMPNESYSEKNFRCSFTMCPVYNCTESRHKDCPLEEEKP